MKVRREGRRTVLFCSAAYPMFRGFAAKVVGVFHG